MSPRGPAARMPFAAEVAAYLADCAASRARLDPAYHPTEAGAVKLVFHRRHHDAEADQAAEQEVRAAFRALTAMPVSKTAPAGFSQPGLSLSDNPDQGNA